jgi:hypothetical protein
MTIKIVSGAFRMTPPSRCPARHPFRHLALLALAAGALAPSRARSQEPTPEAEPEVVAEALFLCDTLPPGGRDLNLSLGVEKTEVDAATGETGFTTSPRLQLAMALNDRVGFTADVGIDTGGEISLDAPGASLKLLLRAPGAGRTGLSASVDLFGSTHSLHEAEAGVGLGAIRSIGRLGLRASASLASGVSSWSPHLHTGVSAAVALGSRWRALGEVLADLSDGEVAVSAGPTVKVQLGEHTALMAGALFQVARDAGMPAFLFQLTRSM